MHLEAIKRVLAEANMRYSITVTNEGSTVIVNGHRDRRPFSEDPVEMVFNPEGLMTYCRPALPSGGSR